MNKSIILITIFIFFAGLFIISNANAIFVDTGVTFQVDNQNYTMQSIKLFSTISIYDDHIIFNTTSFNMYSPNYIDINISYLRNAPLTANTDDRIISFNATCITGLVRFNLTGFSGNANYYVKRDSVNIANMVSTATGVIRFNSSSWSTHDFSVYRGSYSTGGGTTTSSTISETEDSFSFGILLFMGAIIFISVLYATAGLGSRRGYNDRGNRRR